MNTRSENTTQDKNQSVANSLEDTVDSTHTGSQIADNRPEGIAQRKMQQIMANGAMLAHPIQKKGENLTAQLEKEGESIDGEFTSMPGNLNADWMDDNVYGAAFDMKAKFNPDVTPEGGRGEYRQYIKGFYKIDGEIYPHELYNGEALSADAYKEDGIGNDRAYGHRDIVLGNSYFEDAGEEGSTFTGQDAPGIPDEAIDD